MKDRQIRTKPEEQGIPLLSPLLHVLAMPVLVFLRRGFGISFLRPKSILLALCICAFLHGFAVWLEPQSTTSSETLSLFLCTASAFYLLHLIRATFDQFGDPPHEHDSGRSWLALLIPDQNRVRLLAEPGLVLAASLYLRSRSPVLAGYLLWAAIALFLKEGVNRWKGVRKVNRQRDTLDDAQETVGKAHDSHGGPGRKAVAGTTRKRRVHRPRAGSASAAADSELERHAATLRMLPPYTLDQANENYRQLVLLAHPDTAKDKKKAEAEASRLIEAIKFMRQELGE